MVVRALFLIVLFLWVDQWSSGVDGLLGLTSAGRVGLWTDGYGWGSATVDLSQDLCYVEHFRLKSLGVIVGCVFRRGNRLPTVGGGSQQ